MGKCAQCGNNYDRSFEVTMDGRTAVFDSFECAIAALAPICPHCHCRRSGMACSMATPFSAAYIAPSTKA
jgi:hypothetical protein